MLRSSILPASSFEWSWVWVPVALLAVLLLGKMVKDWLSDESPPSQERFRSPHELRPSPWPQNLPWSHHAENAGFGIFYEAERNLGILIGAVLFVLFWGLVVLIIWYFWVR